MELKDIIKTRRKELNLTLADIATACNVSEATVSRWESGDIGDMKRSRDDKAKYIDEYALIYGNIQHDMQYKFISFHFFKI